MDISRHAFCIPRTPVELRHYYRQAYEYISAHEEMKKAARLKKGMYKTFLEEFLPFNAYCTWRYGDRTDVLCSLVPGSDAGDALCEETSSGVKHIVEITWPIDGNKHKMLSRQLNERGVTELELWDYDDISEHQNAVERTLDVARRKALRNYYCDGDSTLIVVFDLEEPSFWQNNPKHARLLSELFQQLKTIEFKANKVLLMLMPKKRIVVVQSAVQKPFTNASLSYKSESSATSLRPRA